MERQKPRTERARRNRTTATFLMQRRHNPQERLRIIEQRHQSLNSVSPLPSQTTVWSEKELTENK